MYGLEVNEVFALVFVIVATVITGMVRLHPANTVQTRVWWGRFLILLCILVIAQLCTNLEQFGGADNRTLNIIEHLALLAAGLWALHIAIEGIRRAYWRVAQGGEP